MLKGTQVSARHQGGAAGQVPEALMNLKRVEYDTTPLQVFGGTVEEHSRNETQVVFRLENLNPIFTSIEVEEKRNNGTEGFVGRQPGIEYYGWYQLENGTVTLKVLRYKVTCEKVDDNTIKVVNVEPTYEVVNEEAFIPRDGL